MHPKVLKELLTHGHGDSKVDEKASSRYRNMPPDLISSKQKLATAEIVGEKSCKGFRKIWHL
jgi:hypothetical protein